MPSTVIYSEFKPTYLYIKKHSLTGLLYFGKTIRSPEKYLGSGIHWSRHISKYGKYHVVTLWSWLFTDKQLLIDVATEISKQFNIVESSEWANLAIETGVDGGTRINNHFKTWSKHPKTEEHKMRQSLSMIKIQTDPNSKSKRNRMKRCEVDGIVFASITAAGKHFKVSDAAVHWWFKTGRATRL